MNFRVRINFWIVENAILTCWNHYSNLFCFLCNIVCYHSCTDFAHPQFQQQPHGWTLGLLYHLVITAAFKNALPAESFCIYAVFTVNTKHEQGTCSCCPDKLRRKKLQCDNYVWLYLYVQVWCSKMTMKLHKKPDWSTGQFCDRKIVFNCETITFW